MRVLFEHSQLNGYLAGGAKGSPRRVRHCRINYRIERKANVMRFRQAAAIAVIALVVYGCSATGDEDTSTTEAPQTSTTRVDTTTTTTPPPEVDTATALSTAAEYFEAYNGGDATAVLALFQPDATFSDNFGDQPRSSWEQLLAWNMAQGTQLESIECDASEPTEQSVEVVCGHTNLDAVVQAVEGPPVPVTLTLTVESEGIADWEFIFGQPDFLTVLAPLGDWMSTHYPDDADKIGFGTWTSVESATENGQLMAQYAEVWKTYLADNGCTFADNC